MTIPNMKEKKLRLENIHLQVNIPSSNNIELSFDESSNGLKVILRNISTNLSLKWKKKILFKIKGKFHVKGEFDKIELILGFNTQIKDGFIIPSVYTKSASIDIDKHKWKADFGHKNIANEIGNVILRILRGKGIKLIKKECMKQLEKKIPNIINKGILKKYKTEGSLTPWLSLSLANTGPINVNKDYLALPIDGTIFLVEDGYNKTIKSSEIPLVPTTTNNDIVLVAGRYSFKTLETSMNKLDFEYYTKADKLDVRIFIPGNNKSYSITNTATGLHVKVKGTLTLVESRMSIDIEISANVTMSLSNGDENEMFYLNPEIVKNSINIKTSNVAFVKQKLGLSLLTPLFDPIIEYFTNKIKLKSVPVKKLDDSKLLCKVKKNDVKFSPKYAQVELSFTN
eukprot:CAMPEP_0205808114 /NCGR_PEP_ID=MMETSP0205-20121125/11980_1 /ASSEMBLY_ACC=CAM_ASM_000278 /TAXON_ID=36767 /ORGANISM="Euplotes focardii, Strain TN1" /LENGTH=397 /DNA_ID=CAMNT_0053083293 /DNA_START=169 /DNA_END=1362 /DNA_ORIENTATION=+